MVSVMRFFVCTVLVFESLGCVAQHMNAPDAPCRGVSGTTDAFACFSGEWVKADRELNTYYKSVQTLLKGDQIGKLQQAQRLWLRFRDANCDAEYALYGGGTGGPVTRMACMEAMTLNRVQELKTMYDWRLHK